ncbi:MAG: Addiction module toxin, RelE/StbE family [Berkelbacteria bacterium GW2011_GWA2_46_7]|uniref:Addiction module toxin, RelE/StbE family n=1 Tax=Berkelbacteria bacterium GW2011_GWA2_46_7 TaxID=1618335 RepID=A0A0G1QHQ8_9BACT|nr:MAG: Addiction module toxin, RelE/StbE family [Berkelbacteria bacterium GW2011_GWA2_46_7]
MQFTFAESAGRDVEKLSKKIQQGIREKLLYWQSSSNALDHAKPLSQHIEATHRFRIGVYRILIKKIGNELRILRVRHRKDVYR